MNANNDPWESKLSRPMTKFIEGLDLSKLPDKPIIPQEPEDKPELLNDLPVTKQGVERLKKRIQRLLNDKNSYQDKYLKAFGQLVELRAALDNKTIEAADYKQEAEELRQDYDRLNREYERLLEATGGSGIVDK